MDKLRVIVMCLSALCVFGGCTDGSRSSNHSGADAGQPVDVGPLDAKSFNQQRRLARRRARCETAFNDCPDQTRNLMYAAQTTSVEECVEVFRRRLEALDLGPLGIECGHMTFDEQAARTCLEDLIERQRADVCYTPSAAEEAACDEAFQPAVEQGGECLDHAECISGNCETAFGTCGEPIYRSALGEACGSGEGPCADTTLRCERVIGSDYDRVCIAVGSRQQGQPCSVTDSCAEGLICRDDICIARKPAELGEACIRYPLNQASMAHRCAPGLVCTNVDSNYDGTCARLGEAGDTCADQVECRVGLYCEPDTGLCTPHLAPGDPCEHHWGCGPLSSCRASEAGGSTCQRQTYGNAPCFQATD